MHSDVGLSLMCNNSPRQLTTLPAGAAANCKEFDEGMAYFEEMPAARLKNFTSRNSREEIQSSSLEAGDSVYSATLKLLGIQGNYEEASRSARSVFNWLTATGEGGSLSLFDAVFPGRRGHSDVPQSDRVGAPFLIILSAKTVSAESDSQPRGFGSRWSTQGC